MLKLSYVLSVAVVVFAGSLCAGTVDDEQLGYSVFLPDGWVKTAVSATRHRFEDTSGGYRSMVVINRYDFSAETVYEVPEDWTRANFIAYVFSVEADPFSALVYYDSVTARQNESLWATDAFSQFFSIDTTLGDWAEYIRFTASGTYGYEIYAIGPADDMLVNVGRYVAIIEGITLPETSVATTLRQVPGAATAAKSNIRNGITVDVLGRVFAAGDAQRSRNFMITGQAGTLRAYTWVVLR